MLKKKTLLICTFLPQTAEGPAPIGLGNTGLKKGILSGRRGIYVPSQCSSQVTWQLDVGYLRRGRLCSGKISLVLAFLGFSFVIHPP